MLSHHGPPRSVFSRLYGQENARGNDSLDVGRTGA